MSYTIVEYYGKQNGSQCGYCKGTQSSFSHGMHAYSMFPHDYQDLIDRGWRRSGHYCYKQENKTTCCPCYTIRCDALEFKLSKSHKKVLKRMNRFLRDGKGGKVEEGQQSSSSHANDDGKKGDNDDAEEGDVGGGGISEEVKGPDLPLKDVSLEGVTMSNESEEQAESSTSQPKVINARPSSDELSSSGSKNSSEAIKPPHKKYKQMRLERKLANQAARGLPKECPAKKTLKNQQKSLQDLINETRPDDKHKLKLEIIHVESQEFHRTRTESYALYKKYQTIVHNDPPSGVESYLDFLQRSPLKFSKLQNGPPSGFGSFHQQYWLDDKLIAVGVIDVLPNCISSVYFFYDPDYSFLSLGTYSSLREIELVQKLANIVPSLKYYYMGFYIHSCPKMRYKCKLSPSYLLCPEAYTWHLFDDEIREKLDVSKYQRFNNDLLARDMNEFKDSDIDLVLVLINTKTYMKYRLLKLTTSGIEQRAAIIEYGKLVGKALAHRMLYMKY